MMRKISKVVRFCSFLLIVIPAMLWLVYFNIDRFLWLSYFGSQLHIEGDTNKVTYQFHPVITIAATNKELLTRVMSSIDKQGWENTATINGVTIQSYFSHDGFDYGGVVVQSPGVIISYKRNANSLSVDKYWSIFDIREFCGDTPKNGICSYNNPFKDFTVLSISLGVYTLVCVALFVALVVASVRSNRKMIKI